MNRQNKKRMSLLLVFCLLITMGGFGNLKWANAADTTMAVADAEATEEPVPTGVPNYTAEPQATGTDDDFRVGISYVSKDWKESHMTDFTTNQVMQITAEGNYSISYTVGKRLQHGYAVVGYKSIPGVKGRSGCHRCDNYICRWYF